MKTPKTKRATKRPVTARVQADEVLPEYDFTRARANAYASHYARGSVVVTLDPDMAAVFPGAREVNDALRAVAGTVSQPAAPRGQVIDLMEALKESLAKRGIHLGAATEGLPTKVATPSARQKGQTSSAKRRVQPGQT